MIDPLKLLVIDEGFGLGGIERVGLELLPQLARHCERLVWLMPEHRIADTRRAIGADCPIELQPLHRRHGGWGNRVAAGLLGRGANCARRFVPPVARWLEEAEERSRLAAHVRIFRPNHVLYLALFTQPWPQLSVPVSAIIYDVNYHPHWRNRCEDNLRRWSATTAKLLTISEFSRSEIARVVPGARAKPLAIPIAINYSAIPQLPPKRAGAMDSEPVPRLFYPASLNPHKGHALLLSALARLHEQGRNFHLTLAGSGTEKLKSNLPLEDPTLESGRQVLVGGSDNFRSKVELLGRVSNEVLEQCYEQADWVALPSSYEGFGLPLGEAVARQKSVICADLPAFREQARLYGFESAVAFVASGSVAHWVAALDTALRGEGPPPLDREQLDGIFARWTWRDAASAYAKALQSA